MERRKRRDTSNERFIEIYYLRQRRRKSTLIGHILYDAKLLYADQEKDPGTGHKVGSRSGAIDYSLLLDGLMAEREQGITIDVAYRYFTTDNLSFIVADTGSRKSIPVTWQLAHRR